MITSSTRVLLAVSMVFMSVGCAGESTPYLGQPGGHMPTVTTQAQSSNRQLDGPAVQTRGHAVLDPPRVIATAENGGAGKRKVSVKLSNSGAGPLHIQEIQTSCSCALADPVQKRDLLPGESLEIALSIHIPEVGESKQTATVILTGADSSSIAIPIEMRGAPLKPPYIHIRPAAFVSLRRTTATGRIEGEVSFTAIESATGGDWVKSVRMVDERFQATIEPTETTASFEAAIERTYVVKLWTDQAPGPELSLISSPCEMQDAEGKVVAYTMASCDLSPPVRVVPTVLRLKLDAALKPIDRDILIVSSDGIAPDQIQLVEGTKDFEVIEIGELNGTSRKIRLRYSPHMSHDEKLPIDSMIAFSLKHPDQSQVSLRVVIDRK